MLRVRMRVEDARWQLFAKQLPGLYEELVKREVYFEEVLPVAEMQENSLGELNSVLFDQLRDLRACDPRDVEALRAEIERSKAVEGMARMVVGNANVVMEAARMRAEYAPKNGMAMPRMLEG